MWSGIAAMLSCLLLAASCGGSGGPPRTAVDTTTAPTVSTTAPSTPPSSPSPSTAAVPEPSIVTKLIPFPQARKLETRAYALEHYALDTFRLEHPQVIVEHFTASETFQPVFNTFANDQPHLGELPGTCAHFVIDTDGTIYQLVPLDLICRHTVGLNYTAVGIEMVGMSDQDILDRPAQLSSALSLTLWLMDRFDIQLRNVIGHNESLTSPLRKELVPSLRCQTHQDWNHDDMQEFRADLARLVAQFDVSLGPPATPVKSGC